MKQKKQAKPFLGRRDVIYLSLIVIFGVAGLLLGKTLQHKLSMLDVPLMPPLVTTQNGEILASTVPGLQAALITRQNPNPCAATEGRFKQIVLAVTADKTQALVGYSCGSTGMVRMVMFMQDNQWKVIGGSDQKFKSDIAGEYDPRLGVLSCTVADQYAIQASIVPVCHEAVTGENGLSIGAAQAYDYRVR